MQLYLIIKKSIIKRFCIQKAMIVIIVNVSYILIWKNFKKFANLIQMTVNALF